ncbi:MAG: hypothetical protein WBB69_07125 [Anaerolineales bacterium]
MADMYLIFGSLILLGISNPIRQPKWLSPASWLLHPFNGADNANGGTT